MRDIRHRTGPDDAARENTSVRRRDKTFVRDTGDMTYLLVTTIAAALLAGLLALPFTLPGIAQAGSRPAPDPGDLGPPSGRGAVYATLCKDTTRSAVTR